MEKNDQFQALATDPSISQAWKNQAEDQHLPLGSRFLLTDQYVLVSVTQQGVQFQIIIISL